MFFVMKEKINGKIEKNKTAIYYLDKFSQILSNEFIYDNIDDLFVNPDWVDFLLRINGHIAVFKSKTNPEKLVAVAGCFAGICSEEYPFGDEYNGTTFFEGYRGKIDEDCVIVKNNKYMTREKEIDNISKFLVEIDTSILKNIIYTRLAPIIRGTDSKTIAKIDELLNNVIDGNIKTITDRVDDIFADQQHSDIDVLNLTDSSKIAHVQYLSQLYSDIEQRFYKDNGFSMHNVNKKAQVSEDEITGGDIANWIKPENEFLARKMCFDKVNDMFKTNISVRYSELWQTEHDKVFGIVENSVESVENNEEVEEEEDKKDEM